jgi:hypothetical protein
MKDKNNKQTLPTSLLIPFVALTMINIWWIGVAILSWFQISEWGWSLPLKVKAVILIICVLTISIVALFLIRKWVEHKIIAMVSLITLFIISGSIGIFITSYSPRRPGQEVTLKQLGISGVSIFQMSACNRVEKFADAGYQYLEGHGSPSVLLPDWFHQSLQDIPKNILVDCIKDEITKQLQDVHGDSWEREVATKKIYALLYESFRLKILDSPAILEVGNILVCQKRIDSIGRIGILYYIGQHGHPPAYDYFSDDGKAKLLADICKP